MVVVCELCSGVLFVVFYGFIAMNRLYMDAWRSSSLMMFLHLIEEMCFLKTCFMVEKADSAIHLYQ